MAHHLPPNYPRDYMPPNYPTDCMPPNYPTDCMPPNYPMDYMPPNQDHVPMQVVTHMPQSQIVYVEPPMPKDYIIWSMFHLIFCNPFCLGFVAFCYSIKVSLWQIWDSVVILSFDIDVLWNYWKFRSEILRFCRILVLLIFHMLKS